MLGLLATSLVTVSAISATLSLTIAPNSGPTNLLAPFNGAAKITQLVVTANSNTATLYFIDTPAPIISYTNAAYTGYTRYPTNYVFSWTNFYGVVNSTTNIALATITNTVAATTNLYPVRITAVAGTSATKYDNVNYYFNSGVYVTNGSSSSAVVTVTFQ